MYNESYYKSVVMNSLNPFILFNKDGKLIDFNKDAEFLFNDVPPRELYELALNNASHSFGFEHKFINLSYGKDSYYAILVGYIDDEFLGIELYKQVDLTKRIVKNLDMEFVNIYSLLEIAKNTILNTDTTKTEEIYDTSLPEVKVNINNFLLTLNEFFKLVTKNTKLTLKVFLKIGEYEIIDGKKHNIITIECIGENHSKTTQALETQAYETYINVVTQDNTIKLEFPMILN